MKIKSKRIRFLLRFIVILISFILFSLWQNNDIVRTNIAYKNSKIPLPFDGYTIVQISDLHNKEFGSNQTKLLNKVEKAEPDIIVITGDLIDSKHPNIDIAMEFVNGAIKIAPVYYVTGNHEAFLGIYSVLERKLANSGVILMDDKEIQIEKDGSYIDLIGVSDPSFTPYDYLNDNGVDLLEGRLEDLVKSNEDSFKILLSHRPELLNTYEGNNIDLAFTGHAHGGQFRIPFVGGLFAPNQGFFPKYTSGTYTMNKTTLVVSRGLGNSVIPIRIFNRPEIIVLTLGLE